jgi:hypothetical protein
MGVRAWQKPKFAHRRWVNRLLQAQMHVILCLRGDEKLVKTKVDGREIFVEGPIVPEQEKRLIFEMTLQAMLEVGTNKVSWTKIPGQLRPALPDGVVITAATGAAIRDWVNEGVAVDLEFERLVSVSRSAAGFGTAAYRGYWDKLPADQKKRLLAHHEEFKAIAAASDTIAVEDDEEAEAEQGDPFAPIGG